MLGVCLALIKGGVTSMAGYGCFDVYMFHVVCPICRLCKSEPEVLFTLWNTGVWGEGGSMTV
jgi:hypothetical protein